MPGNDRQVGSSSLVNGKKIKDPSLFTCQAPGRCLATPATLHRSSQKLVCFRIVDKGLRFLIEFQRPAELIGDVADETYDDGTISHLNITNWLLTRAHGIEKIAVMVVAFIKKNQKCYSEI